VDSRTFRRWISKVDKTDPAGCWLWTASLDQDGYGWFRDGRVRRAHRVSYEHHIGPVEDGHDVDHICRVRHCVNPDHLRAISRKENVLSGVGPTATNARKKRCKRGHAFTPENTLVHVGGWRQCRECRRIAERRRAAA
jgi:hypothetical protein